MHKVTEKTKGIPGNCILQICSECGGYEECFATGNFCKVDGGMCPFDDNDEIQINIRKEK